MFVVCVCLWYVWREVGVCAFVVCMCVYGMCVFVVCVCVHDVCVCSWCMYLWCVSVFTVCGGYVHVCVLEKGCGKGENWVLEETAEKLRSEQEMCVFGDP